MENKLYDSNAITLDGRLDKAVWETAEAHTGFHFLKSRGGIISPVQTVFKVISCEDRIFIGVKCLEPDMEYVENGNQFLPIWEADTVEVFMSPSCNYFDFYQFVVAFDGKTVTNFYSEGGNICPDRYAPQWNSAIYKGEDFWSVEMEIPLTAFYMTPNAVWGDTWLFNVCRSRTYKDINTHRMMFCTWSELEGGYKDSKNYRELSGFPMRPACDDLRISTAIVDITEETEEGFCGTLTVKTMNPEDGEFVFTSDCTQPCAVSLKAGINEFSIPCCFAERGRYKPALQLERLRDGKVFKRYYPVRVSYEAIKFSFTLPEYRCNFYPGQDYSKIVGKVIANKPVTLKLEGPGIAAQTITPDADGSFCFDAPNFEVGEAFLTATTEDRTLIQKIRRLAPSGRMMSWISGGNLIVDGKPVLRRNMYAQYYHGGEAFKRKYDEDNLHITKFVRGQAGDLQPDGVLRRMGLPNGEVTKDVKPCDALMAYVDKLLENNKERDFVSYYLSDEPECRALSPVYLKYLYDYIADKDPYHVILIATRSGDVFVDTADWFEAHPYINPYTGPDGRRVYDRPINTLGKCIDDIAKLNRPDKCIGFLPTCFGAERDKPDCYPTFAEMVCHTWTPMLRGGKTLYPYAYHDLNDRAALYERIRYLFSSFEALENLVLFGKRTVLVKNLDVESVLYDTGDEQMFVLVNMTQDPQKATLEGLSGTWHNFRHGGTITGNAFDLEPFEVVIGTSTVKDTGLPTYQETAALIDKLEYQRTHGGSLLFERHQDLTFTASASVGAGVKLFDGVRDNYAWECRSEKEKFLEINLTKVKPTFTKVVVHGLNVDDMAVKVRNGEALSVPAIAEIQTEEYTTTVVLTEPICPDCLRLEFNRNRVELYEIEIF